MTTVGSPRVPAPCAPRRPRSGTTIRVACAPVPEELANCRHIALHVCAADMADAVTEGMRQPGWTLRWALKRPFTNGEPGS